MNILNLKDLSFSYENLPLFKNVTLSLRTGEVIGILGSNGAGKTTLFDLICHIKKPSGGQMLNSARRQAYLTQILTPPPLLRMSETGALIKHLSSTVPPSQSEIMARLARWSPALYKRYDSISQKKVARCSYGEIRSYFTLTLLLLRSDLIILDEPTAGVDAEFRHFIWFAINAARKEGASVLVSSHYTEEIAANCDRFYLLANQRLDAFGSGGDFMSRYNASSLDEAFITASSHED
ncbi:ATP-binding cassette domain-containing protein [Pseudomonas vlassakiae]|uniref:ATP-binding cassette domain-containing protein n=1 Tax=Pseudomonas vlassakiae TaxID=485888 RepID=UPI0021C63C54|nr:ATP-binding cassette domain-containing protein [Pseudomonas vlassakiae]MCU0126572.1 ATP-binding cassette domain-containing protein [Pseudomonas vlassakiae]